MSDDLVVPEGWTRTTLGNIGRYLNGRAFKTQEWSRTGRPIIRIQDLTGSNRNPNYFDGEIEDRYIVRPGDFLISWSATLGAYIWDGPEGVLNQHIFKVESNIDKRFHYHLVRERIGELERHAHGSGMVHVTKGIFNDTPVAVPDDPAVQRQLADLIGHTDALQSSSASHLAAARRAVERFRQGVLAAACSGRLTADWRDMHLTCRGDEVLDASLDIRAKDRKLSRKPVELPDESAGGDPPSGWVLATADQLCSVITDGEHATPPRTPEGVPLLSARNVLNGSIVFEPIDHISEETYLRLARRLEPTAGDVLLTCSGTIGRSAVVLQGMRFSLVRSVAVLRPSVMNSDYLSLVLRSPLLQLQIMNKKTETAQANLFQGRIRTLTLPVPSVDEQVEIVRRADQLFGMADGLRCRIDAASKRVDRSSQAVLAKAFRGELIGAASAAG
ncbi:restriction endonuclease subunit S [Mycobacterium sp.]|uniref:restriction endonuclease subunit S n=1 Tax=Mycobacterium sp. TaxID=1785 RepID=UPI003F992489